MEDLLAPLGDSGAGEAAAADLTHIATQYWRYKAQRLDGPSRRSTRGALRDVASRANDLLTALAATEAQGRFHLGLELQRRGAGMTGGEALDQLQHLLIETVAAASSAHKALSKGSDRLPPDELRWAMPELIALWERLSGQPFTHTRNEDGEPTSPAGRFVRSFFDTVDEAVPFTTIVTELERARRSRRKAAAGGAKARQGKSVTP